MLEKTPVSTRALRESLVKKIRGGRVATILTSALVLAAILIPGREIPDIGFAGMDKAAHFIMFWGWALALRFDFRGFARRPWNLIALGAVAAIGTETAQLFVDGRSFDPRDMAFDLAGVAVAALLGKKCVAIADRILEGHGSA